MWIIACHYKKNKIKMYKCLERKGINAALLLLPIIRIIPFFLLAVILPDEQVVIKIHVF